MTLIMVWLVLAGNVDEGQTKIQGDANPPRVSVDRVAVDRVAVDRVAVGGATVNGATENPEADGSTALPEPIARRFFDINKEMRQLLREEAVTKDRRAWELTVVKLVEIYAEIMRDSRLPTSGTLNGYRIKLRSRLLKIKKQLELEIAQRDKGRPSGGRLAKLVRSGSGATQPSGSMADVSAGMAGGHGGAAADYGSILVELIERTISPDFWDVNGGPGSIVYYRQWHALVVRATPEIHRQIGGAVEGARK